MERPLIGILACDRPATPELLAHADGETYGDMYARMLTQADPTIRTRVYDVDLGELPVTVDECDAWIITGARFDAYRDEPWIVALRDFVGLIGRGGTRLAGVCFGHQLIAHALGGTAAPAGEWRVGPETMTVEPTAWFEGGTVTIHAVHQDVVTALPTGARAIAIGSTAAVPAYVVGETILGIQDHPEFTDAYVAALVEARRERIGDALADEGLERIATVPTHGATVGRWLADFLLDRRR